MNHGTRPSRQASVKPFSAGKAPVAAALHTVEMNYVCGTGGAATTPVAVTIHDGRSAPLAGWQDCGFELLEHRSDVGDWDDDAIIAAVHYPEMEALACSLTGCDQALVSGHIRRNPEEAARHADLGPITFVHSDFAESYGELIRRRYAEPEHQSRLALERAGISADQAASAQRMVILQFWRNTGPARMDLPIAFCDARSVPEQDLRRLPVSDYAGGGIDFETLAVAAPGDPRRHHWYAYPRMQATEVVAFRTFDSAMIDNGGAFWTPHSAYLDPQVPRGRPSRRSIELRATCLFFA